MAATPRLTRIRASGSPAVRCRGRSASPTGAPPASLCVPRASVVPNQAAAPQRREGHRGCRGREDAEGRGAGVRTGASPAPPDPHPRHPCHPRSNAGAGLDVRRVPLRPPSVSLASLRFQTKPLHHRDARDTEETEAVRLRKAAAPGSERAPHRRKPPPAIPAQPAVHQRIRSGAAPLKGFAGHPVTPVLRPARS